MSKAKDLAVVIYVYDVNHCIEILQCVQDDKCGKSS